MFLHLVKIVRTQENIIISCYGHKVTCFHETWYECHATCDLPIFVL